MTALQNKFASEFERTSSNRFRQPNDMQLQFAYSYFLIHEKNWGFEVDHSQRDWNYLELKGDPSDVENELASIIAFDWFDRWRKKFLCINDNIDYSNTTQAAILIDILVRFYNSMFPNASQFEILYSH